MQAMGESLVLRERKAPQTLYWVRKIHADNTVHVHLVEAKRGLQIWNPALGDATRAE